MRIHIDTKPFLDFITALEGVQAIIDSMGKAEVNKVTDRHLARIKRNTDVGDSPYSPTLRNTWDRSQVHVLSDAIYAEVFNPTHYAPYYEYGHRQTPGRLVFIELAPGQEKYGRPAIQVGDKWGIFIKLQKPFVKGKFVMTDSEEIAQKELDASARRIMASIKKKVEGGR